MSEDLTIFLNYCVEAVFAESFVCGLSGRGGQPLSGISKGRKHHPSQSSRAIKYLIVLGTEFAMATAGFVGLLPPLLGLGI